MKRILYFMGVFAIAAVIYIAGHQGTWGFTNGGDIGAVLIIYLGAIYYNYCIDNEEDK